MDVATRMPALESRPPTAAERRIFPIAVVLYAALAASLLPWAREPGLANPRITAVVGTAILVADVSTALLLSAWYLASGRAPLLALACGYLWSSVMVVLHVVTFPGAFFADPLFGTQHTVGWLYSAWRGGAASAWLAAVVLETWRRPVASPRERGLRLAVGHGLVLLACVLIAVLAAQVGVPSMTGGTRWTSTNTSLIWLWVALCFAALALLWVRRAFDDTLYLWLALVLVATIVDLTLGNVAGARYTLAWYASRASLVVSSYLLLAFLVAGVAERRTSPRLGTVAAHGAAVAVALAAVFLRWFLDPWLGAAVPYITLFGAVAISVYLAGWWPAVVTAGLGYGIIHLLYAAPPGAGALGGPPQAVQVVLFGLSCALIIGLGEGMRRARDRHRSAETESRERAAALQRADASKGRFLAVLSHELRNPLAPLRTGLAILRTRPETPQRPRVEAMMERQLAALTRLIDDLLDVSRIDRGLFELRPERIRLEAVVAAAIETAGPNLDARSHALTVHHAEPAPYVDGDPVRLAQAVGNLLNNAAKFTPPGGRIELSTRTEAGRAVLSVTDNGIGVAPEHLGTIFEGFTRVEAGGATAGGGLGLGLTLVRAIVEGHGGQVEARSAGPNRGAEFIIRLPLASAAARASIPPAPVRASSSRRVLVVDDNADAAETVADLLRMEGHRVEAVNDGATALRAAQELEPVVAFIDLDMPEMNGIELAARLRSTSHGRDMRIVALTGMGQQSDRARTRAAGFDEHLTKPADPQRILNIVAAAKTGPISRR